MSTSSGEVVVKRRVEYAVYFSACLKKNLERSFKPVGISDELLNREVFTTLTEAKILIEQRAEGVQSSKAAQCPGYRPPAPEAIMPLTHNYRKWYN